MSTWTILKPSSSPCRAHQARFGKLKWSSREPNRATETPPNRIMPEASGVIVLGVRFGSPFGQF
eukprot:4478058-Pyramimonas_sp.AAC.1